MILVLLQIL